MSHDTPMVEMEDLLIGSVILSPPNLDKPTVSVLVVLRKQGL